MRLIADRYELLDSIGSGGMAHVYRARDRVLERIVAVKLLREDIADDSTLRERFLREARFAGALTHRNIIRVYDAGVEDRTPWMAMELVEGPSLRQRMTELGTYPVAEALEVFADVLAALQAAHEANVIHRDIKPANILLAEDGAKLGDFGIAKSLGTIGADLTQINQFLGTPKYTPPEVATGDRATKRSDLYSAAVLFWEMLAGHPPYVHENPLTLAMMHRTDPLPSLGEERPDLPAALVAALEQALAKDPANRPADAATFARNLRSAADLPPPPPVTPLPTGTPTPGAPSPRASTQVLARPPAHSGPTRPSSTGGRGGADRSRWGLLLVVAVLVGLAVVAFSVASSDDGDVTPTPSPTATTPTSTPTDPSTPAAVPTTPTGPPTQSAPAPAPAPTSTAQPTTPATVEPTAEPTPTPEPTTTAEPTSAPSPTPQPTQDDAGLIPLPLPADREPSDPPSPTG